MRSVRTVALVCLLFATSLIGADKVKRTVVNNVLTSDSLPRITISVEPSLKYLGKFDFNLRNIAGGERHVWAETSAGRVKRMFIVQLEGFLPNVDDYYKYPIRTPVKLGKHTYSHNLWFYNDDETRRADPPNEAGMTAKFLAERGLSLDSDLIMSRFARIVGEDKRNEIIFFYWENMRDHGLTAADFPKEEPVTPEHKKLAEEFFQRSLSAFSVRD
jgi:hypothetical protein